MYGYLSACLSASRINDVKRCIWNVLNDPAFGGVGLVGFKSIYQCLSCLLNLLFLFVFHYFLFSCLPLFYIFFCLPLFSLFLSSTIFSLFLVFHYFLFFCLPLFYLFLPFDYWFLGVGDFGLIECFHSLPP